MSPDAGLPGARRPRRRAVLGLRLRLVLALVLTATVTLAAAALALFSPLQDRLRAQAESNLRAAVLTARPQFRAALRRSDGRLSEEINRLGLSLTRRTNSRVIVTDSVPERLYDSGAGPTTERDILRVLIGQGTQVSADEDETRIATPLNVDGETFVLAVRRPPEDAAAIVETVRDAFVTAALIGLGVALALGLAVVATLLRRLERLRTAAVRIATEGPTAPPPADETNDELGDLARTLAAMQAALHRQEAARRSFVATASHELRTPLTSLGGTLELLEEDLRDGRMDLADAHRQIAMAQGEVGRLAHLASDLLDLSRLDAETPLRSEPVELLEVCRAVAAEFSARARTAGVDLDVVLPPGPCWARADPGAVARIVRLLLDNALRYATGGRTVRIVPAYHGPSATIEVRDEGPGVPAEDRDRIFERFERGSAAGREGGFGLGLAIGRELAHRQGGRLDLLDARHGARFRLTLPIEMLELP